MNCPKAIKKFKKKIIDYIIDTIKNGSYYFCRIIRYELYGFISIEKMIEKKKR